jgi:hypothetical protein
VIVHLMNSKEMFQDDVLLRRTYIELHTLKSSIQKIKLIGKYGNSLIRQHSPHVQPTLGLKHGNWSRLQLFHLFESAIVRT